MLLLKSCTMFNSLLINCFGKELAKLCLYLISIHLERSIMIYYNGFVFYQLTRVHITWVASVPLQAKQNWAAYKSFSTFRPRKKYGKSNRVIALPSAFHSCPTFWWPKYNVKKLFPQFRSACMGMPAIQVMVSKTVWVPV